MRSIERVVEAILRSAEAGGLVEGAERAAFDGGRDLGWTFSLLGGDPDYAADRVGAVKPALRSAQDLDAVDIVSEHLTEIEDAIWVAWIADVDAVDDDLRVIGFGAAQEHRGEATGSSRLDDVQSGHG